MIVPCKIPTALWANKAVLNRCSGTIAITEQTAKLAHVANYSLNSSTDKIWII